MQTGRCIFCRCEFDVAANKPEHIIPCSIGGRVQSRTIVCSGCNGRLGSEIDERLAKLFEFIRFGLVVRDCDGDLPPAVRIETEHGIVEWKAGQPARLIERARPTVVPAGDGTHNISVHADTLEEASTLAAHMIRKAGGSSATKLNTLTAKMVVTPIDERFSLSIPFADHNPHFFRAVAKSGFELFARERATEALSPSFDEVRAFIDRDVSSDCIQFDYDNQPPLPVPVEDAGAAYHCVAGWAHPQTAVIAAVTLFGVFSWTIRLAHSWDGDSFAHAFVIDPLRGKIRFDGPMPPPPPISDDVLAARRTDVADISRRADSLSPVAYERGSSAVGEYTVRRVLESFGLRPGEQIPRERAEEISRGLAEAFVRNRVGGAEQLAPNVLRERIAGALAQITAQKGPPRRK